MRQQQFYFQDDWKVTPRLTFNLGLRYDLNHPARVLHDTYASTDVSLDKIIVASDSKGNISTGVQQVTSIVLPLFASRIVPSSQAGLPPTLRHIDLNNFAPRAGVAWQPGGGFVVRAGYGSTYRRSGCRRSTRSATRGAISCPRRVW